MTKDQWASGGLCEPILVQMMDSTFLYRFPGDSPSLTIHVELVGEGVTNNFPFFTAPRGGIRFHPPVPDSIGLSS